jgi:hypothetical protein
MTDIPITKAMPDEAAGLAMRLPDASHTREALR